MNSERSIFIENVIHYILNAADKKDLQFLLSQDKEWRKFVADTNLSREEAQALREGLLQQKAPTGIEFKDLPHVSQGYRERFLRLYPQVKKEVETLIAQFRALADKADQIHRDSNISYLVADTASLISGILGIVGLGLAPMTAGVSLALAATSLGMNVAAAATKATTSIVENTKMSSIEAEAKLKGSSLANFDDMLTELIADCCNRVDTCGSSQDFCCRVARHIRAMSAMSSAQNLELASNITAESSNLVQSVFGGIVKEVIRGDRFFVGTATGLSILVDICSIVHDSKQLLSGAKVESAERLRQRAQALEEMLEELKRVQERLS
ncbi:apolipoprotein L3-like [Suncus etruscus]|uniref:apolipoprotein L3-like n=1 Tax=Suncus etruscus TaxID=109475 RepID=UPI00210FD303|nr:apolipoprotein L3-like [Suncus etruscus]